MRAIDAVFSPRLHAPSHEHQPTLVASTLSHQGETPDPGIKAAHRPPTNLSALHRPVAVPAALDPMDGLPFLREDHQTEKTEELKEHGLPILLHLDEKAHLLRHFVYLADISQRNHTQRAC